MKFNPIRFGFGFVMLFTSFLLTKFPGSVWNNNDFAVLSGLIIGGLGILMLGLSFEVEK